MAKQTRLICRNCGTHDDLNGVSSWERKKVRCKVCDHDKFDSKKVEIKDGRNAFGYEEDEPEKQGASIMSDFFGGLDYDD